MNETDSHCPTCGAARCQVCGRTPTRARGLCAAHYQKARDTGTVDDYPTVYGGVVEFVVGEVEFLLDQGRGTWLDVCLGLGRTPSGVAKILRQAGRKDLIARLTKSSGYGEPTARRLYHEKRQAS